MSRTISEIQRFKNKKKEEEEEKETHTPLVQFWENIGPTVLIEGSVPIPGYIPSAFRQKSTFFKTLAHDKPFFFYQKHLRSVG